jgi:hypothetical protein
MHLANNKKIIYLPDQHFGAPTRELSLPREKICGLGLKERRCRKDFIVD